MNQDKQPEALRLADACAADWEVVRPHLVVQMLRDQHARILELEAAQAQRAPLDYHEIAMAHPHIGAYGQLAVTERVVRWTERRHGITQEKQG